MVGSEVLVSNGKVKYNLSDVALVEEALRRDEGVLSKQGALRVATGKYTGRSPHDKFIVDAAAMPAAVDWNANAAFGEERFERLYQRMLAYVQQRELFVFDGFAGADPTYQMRVRCINEFAWQNLFIQHLLVRDKVERATFVPDITVLCLPSFKATPEIDGTQSEAFIVLHMTRKMVLIGGTHYAGEMKKAVFTMMNYWLPQQGVLPMHCSANAAANGDTALFFGLSGTGKTTLSADPERRLIGDDEHGWSDRGIFNIEGGCYAKCIHLRHETEPQIWDAIRFGTVLENVALDFASREADYEDGSVTENTRAAYPIHYIPGAVIPGIGQQPRTIIFLTADAFGVLPPIAKLTREQAVYHFLSGYTSKVAGTERGIREPEATFSACFGAPFLPLPALTYAHLLGERLGRHATEVFLINTGWSGGPYGVGQRMPLAYTRAMVTAALRGDFANAAYVIDPVFQIHVPVHCPNVPDQLLQPRQTWQDTAAYDRSARELAQRFCRNMQRFGGVVDAAILAAGPKPD